MSLAKIMGVFRLTRDIELVNTVNGALIAKMGLACSEKYKDKETTLFLDAVAFGKSGEILNQYAGTKGTQIYLVGKLQTDQWTDQNNQKRSKVSMIIESFDFIGNKTQGSGQQPQSYQQQSYSQPQQNDTYQQPYSQHQQQYQQQPPTYYENAQGRPTPPPNQVSQPQQPAPIDTSEDTIPF